MPTNTKYTKIKSLPTSYPKINAQIVDNSMMGSPARRDIPQVIGLGAQQLSNDVLRPAAGMFGDPISMFNLASDQPSVGVGAFSGALSGFSRGGLLGALGGGIFGALNAGQAREDIDTQRLRETEALYRNKRISPDMTTPRQFDLGGLAKLLGDEYEPIQTAAGEWMVTPNAFMSKVNSDKDHEDMEDDEVTDVVQAGTYIFSNAKERQFDVSELADMTVGVGVGRVTDNEHYAFEEMKMSDVLGEKGKMTPAEAAKKIANKIKVEDEDSKDIFVKDTNKDNKNLRMKYLRHLIAHQEERNIENSNNISETSAQSIQQFRSGGYVRKYNNGGGYMLPTVTVTAERPNKETVRSVILNKLLDKVSDMNEEPSLNLESLLRENKHYLYLPHNEAKMLDEIGPIDLGEGNTGFRAGQAKIQPIPRTMSGLKKAQYGYNSLEEDPIGPIPYQEPIDPIETRPLPTNIQPSKQTRTLPTNIQLSKQTRTLPTNMQPFQQTTTPPSDFDYADRLAQIKDKLNSFYNTSMSASEDLARRQNRRNLMGLGIGTLTQGLQSTQVDAPELQTSGITDMYPEIPRFQTEATNRRLGESQQGLVNQLSRQGASRGDLASLLAPTQAKVLRAMGDNEMSANLTNMQQRAKAATELIRRRDANNAARIRAGNQQRQFSNRRLAGIGSQFQNYLSQADSIDTNQFSRNNQIGANRLGLETDLVLNELATKMQQARTQEEMDFYQKIIDALLKNSQEVDNNSSNTSPTNPPNNPPNKPIGPNDPIENYVPEPTPPYQTPDNPVPPFDVLPPGPDEGKDEITTDSVPPYQTPDNPVPPFDVLPPGPDEGKDEITTDSVPPYQTPDNPVPPFDVLPPGPDEGKDEIECDSVGRSCDPGDGSVGVVDEDCMCVGKSGNKKPITDKEENDSSWFESILNPNKPPIPGPLGPQEKEPEPGSGVRDPYNRPIDPIDSRDPEGVEGDAPTIEEEPNREPPENVSGIDKDIKDIEEKLEDPNLSDEEREELEARKDDLIRSQKYTEDSAIINEEIQKQQEIIDSMVYSPEAKEEARRRKELLEKERDIIDNGGERRELDDGRAMVGTFNEDGSFDGVYEYGDGAYREGHFEPDKSGDLVIVEGTIWREDGTVHEGKFEYSEEYGDVYLKEGTYTHKDKSVEEGKFGHDEKRGDSYLKEGTYTYGYGVVEEGKFGYDEEMGITYLKEGTYTYADGTIEEGKFEYNKEKGNSFLKEGTITYPDGTTKEVDKSSNTSPEEQKNQSSDDLSNKEKSTRFLNRLIRGEANIEGDAYQAVSGKLKPDTELTERTIGENNDLYGRKALGAYQIQYPTAIAALKRMGYTEAEARKLKFTPELQEKIAINLLKHRGIDKYRNGEITKTRFTINLAQEWASIPVPEDIVRQENPPYKLIKYKENGKWVNVPGMENKKGITIKKGSSYYEGIQNNKAQFGVKDTSEMIKELKMDNLLKSFPSLIDK